MKKICILVEVLLFSVVVLGQNGQAPTRITLNLTDDPSTSMAVTWRTLEEVEHPQVSYAPASAWIEFAAEARSIDATSTRLNIDSVQAVYHHSVDIRGLSPGTEYLYRVGCDSEWSEWNPFTTADIDNSPFEFVFFGDPQEGIKEFVSRVFRKALMVAPKARFWLFTGDLVPKPERDKYWDEWFNAGNFIFSIIPGIMTPGSHEYYYRKADRTKVHEFTRLWNVHFTLPENGIQGLAERSYFVDYQGVRIIMLDGQSKREEQAEWMDNLLKNNPNRWTIAAVHQPIFSMGKNRDEKETHDAFMPIFDKYGLDLVLTGHDHVYARSHKLYNDEVVTDKETGTVYVVSVSGAKAYPLSFRYGHLMARTGQNIQLFQVISVDDNVLSFKAYTVMGKLFDHFDMEKKKN